MQNIYSDQSKLLYDKMNKLYYYLLLAVNIYGIIFTFIRSIQDIESAVNIPFKEAVLLHIIVIIGLVIVNSRVNDSIICNNVYLLFSVFTYLICSIFFDSTVLVASSMLLFSFVIFNIIILNKRNVIIIGSLGIVHYLSKIGLSIGTEYDIKILYYSANKIILIGFFVFFAIKSIEIFSNYKYTILKQMEYIKQKKKTLNEFAKVEIELKNNSEKMFQLAYYDKLTELPNREYFLKHLNNVCLDKNTTKNIMIADIDSFKTINDFYSHKIGDKVLLCIKDMLNTICGDNSIIARVDGDIFSIILDNNIGYEQVLSRIDKVLSEPLCIEQYKINVTLSIGIVEFPKDGDVSTDLFKNMELAMFKAKEFGKGQHVKYIPRLSEVLKRKVELIEKMKKSLDNKEIYLVYQPIFDVLTNEIKGFEALIRWNNKDLGYVRPDVFIKLAEETGYIIKLSDWIFREAAIFAKKINKGNKRTYVSINLSGILLQREDLYTYITNILKELKVEPHILNLEITETSIVEYFDYAVANLIRLKDLGMKISLDDFGTGYSSLNYLRKLPINTLKIDKTFIDEILIDTKAAIMINEVINLADRLNLDTVAEGVESKDQLDFLVSRNCKFIQGYYLSKPLKEEDALKIFNKYKFKYSDSD